MPSATTAFSLSHIRRGPNTPAQHMPDAVPEEEKSRRLAVLQERQRQIQTARNEKLGRRNVRSARRRASRSARPMGGTHHQQSHRKFHFAASKSFGTIRASESHARGAEQSCGRAGDREVITGGHHGTRGQDPRFDDGSGDQHARGGPEGNAGHRDSAHLGGHLRSQRHRSGNRESADARAR